MFDKVYVRAKPGEPLATWDPQEYVEQFLAACFASAGVARDNWDRLWWVSDLADHRFLERFFLYNPMQRFFWVAHRSLG